MNRNNAFDLNSDDGDLLSDDDESCLYSAGDLRSALNDKSIPSAADRRAHHNALERKRRDHIKDSFSSLRDSVPSLQGEKVSASRAQILKKAAEYIQFMRKKNTSVQTDIDQIVRQNKLLEEQIRMVESQGGSGISLSGRQSLSLLTSEPTDVSSSYISENSNESASNEQLSPMNRGRITTTNNSHHNGLDNKPEQLLINGTNSVVRGVVKNGTNTIIVQNSQLKSTVNSHVIHVTSTGHNNNSSNITSTSTPIIISTSLTPTPTTNGITNTNGGGGGGNSIAVGGTGGGGATNSFIINKATGTFLSNGYRTMVVQPSSTTPSVGGGGGTTTTPNIHIVNSIPSSYSGRTKRFKISPSDSEPVVTGTAATNAAATGNGSTAQSSFNVTSVSS